MRVRTVLLLVAVLVLSAMVGWPQSNRDVSLTNSFRNGRAWRNLDSVQAKVSFLVAYRDGLAFGFMMGKRVDVDLNKDLAPFFPKNLTWEETAVSLDRLYEVPENRPIPIMNALQIVTLQGLGVSKERVDKAIEDLRKPIQE